MVEAVIIIIHITPIDLEILTTIITIEERLLTSILQEMEEAETPIQIPEIAQVQIVTLETLIQTLETILEIILHQEQIHTQIQEAILVVEIQEALILEVAQDHLVVHLEVVEDRLVVHQVVVDHQVVVEEVEEVNS